MYLMKNNKSALREKDFVDKALSDLLEKRCIYEVPFVPHNVSPLSVATNSSGKKRLILDLSVLNLYVKKERVKFEDYKVAKEFLVPHGYMYKYDLTSGYHHIDIIANQHTYLGFSWPVNGRTRYMVFSVLPFGLSSAPRCFCKTLRPLVKFWRSHGLRTLLFLDDGFGINASFELTLRDSNFVQQTLDNAGFVINIEKSIFIPTQILEWLGYIWNLQSGCFIIPDRRRDSAIDCLKDIFSKYPTVTPRHLAKFAGKVLSMAPVLGNVCFLKTKSFYRIIESRCHWDSALNISQCLHCLHFWDRVLSGVLSKPLFTEVLPAKAVYSDASASAGAGYIECDHSIAHRPWNFFEQAQSSTFREMLAINYCLLSFSSKLAGRRVLWHTDSKNCVSIIEKGSMNSNLHDMAENIFTICARNCISLEMKWISRDLNLEADRYSRIVDLDDYGVSAEFFDFLESMYGPHDIDRFANEYSCKVSRYNSLFWTPSTEAVDAFTQDWGNDNNWCVPPVSLAPRALNHIFCCKGTGTFVLPFWPSSPFFPLIFGENSILKPYIQEILLFHEPSRIYVQGNNKESIFGSSSFNSKVLVVRIVFMENRFEFNV
ncbi:uncharacterized protein LOC128558328 [Mercenaria mercenaria]|uniref:uncharacterized protein LOC128558328 n=1 Tax=Mercenaria mercenaria TaxID=6596 RepID=UPI00234F5157|nr:uncharacterized protein LOC128558328 [Mercenaria mercenaria]